MNVHCSCLSRLRPPIFVFVFFIASVVLTPNSVWAQANPNDRHNELRQELRTAERHLAILGSGYPNREKFENRVKELRAKLEKYGNGNQSLNTPRQQANSKNISRPSKQASNVLPETGRLPEKQIPVEKDHRRLVQLSDLKLIGGWRIPAAWQHGKSTAFSMGGISIETLGEKNSFWISHHVHLGGVLRLTGGDPGEGDLKDWPLLVASDYIDVAKPHDRLFGAKISAVHWDPKFKRLWVSGRSHYAVPPHLGPWLVACERSSDGSDWKHAGPYSVKGTTMQRNGGGFCRISPQFASKYLAGRRLGLACGGYESGQGSSLGPTLTATFLSHEKVGQGISLLGFGWNCDETKREFRFPDYKIKSLGWGIDPKNGRGYWAAEEAMGGPAWVETDEVQGLCYFVREGVGELIYALQTQNFTKKSTSRLYRYSLNDLAEVAVGNRQPHEIHASFEEYYVEGTTKDLPGVPRGACFDSSSGRLFVFLKYSWKKGREFMPAIAVFKVAGNPLR